MEQERLDILVLKTLDHVSLFRGQDPFQQCPLKQKKTLLVKIEEYSDHYIIDSVIDSLSLNNLQNSFYIDIENSSSLELINEFFKNKKIEKNDYKNSWSYQFDKEKSILCFKNVYLDKLYPGQFTFPQGQNPHRGPGRQVNLGDLFDSEISLKRFVCLVDFMKNKLIKNESFVDVDNKKVVFVFLDDEYKNQFHEFIVNGDDKFIKTLEKINISKTLKLYLYEMINIRKIFIKLGQMTKVDFINFH